MIRLYTTTKRLSDIHAYHADTHFDSVPAEGHARPTQTETKSRMLSRAIFHHA